MDGSLDESKQRQKPGLSTLDNGKENTINALYIEGRRSGYSPDSCGKTLTVGELIEILSDFDEDLPVYLRNDNGYTYGNITERTIIPSEDLEEGDDE